jgi:hypothetical protein
MGIPSIAIADADTDALADDFSDDSITSHSYHGAGNLSLINAIETSHARPRDERLQHSARITRAG